jgi:hypothetical protein
MSREQRNKEIVRKPSALRLLDTETFLISEGRMREISPSILNNRETQPMKLVRPRTTCHHVFVGSERSYLIALGRL